MKLIKRINRLAEEAQLTADLDQENVIEKDEVIEDNIKEVEDKAAEDAKEIKKINGKQPEDPKPIKEDLADAYAAADAIKAQAEVESAQIIADAVEEENVKNAELDAAAKKDLHDSLITGLIQQFWSLIDECQNVITTLKANDACDGCDAIDEIAKDQYIYVGNLEGLLHGNVEAEESDPIEDGEMADEPIEDSDEDPTPMDDVDIDAEFAEIEEPQDAPQDDEPAPIDVDDDELM